MAHAQHRPCSSSTATAELIHHLTGHVRRSFPALDSGVCEDASADAVRVLWERGLLTPSGMDRARKLGRTIAWRAAYARIYRGPARWECNTADRLPGRRDPDALGRYWVQHDLPLLVSRAAASTSQRHQSALALALWALLVEGGTETELARRHGVRREYLSRAKGALRQMLLQEQLSTTNGGVVQ